MVFLPKPSKFWRTPNSLKDPNVGPNSSGRRSRGTFPSSQHLRGRGACWSFEMGLGRVDKLHSLTRACTKPSPRGYYIVEAPLVLGRATGNTDTQDSPRPGLGEVTTFTLIVYSVTLHRACTQMAFSRGTPAWGSRNPTNGDSRDFEGA
jgi:hypothetical protein